MRCKKDKMDWLMAFLSWGILLAMFGIGILVIGLFCKSEVTRNWGELVVVLGCVATFISSFWLSDEFRKIPTASNEDIGHVQESS